MTKEQISTEMLYHASLVPFKNLLESGVISSEDYELIETILAQKYRPLFIDCIKLNQLAIPARQS